MFNSLSVPPAPKVVHSSHYNPKTKHYEIIINISYPEANFSSKEDAFFSVSAKNKEFDDISFLTNKECKPLTPQDVLTNDFPGAPDPLPYIPFWDSKSNTFIGSFDASKKTEKQKPFVEHYIPKVVTKTDIQAVIDKLTTIKDGIIA